MPMSLSSGCTNVEDKGEAMAVKFHREAGDLMTLKDICLVQQLLSAHQVSWPRQSMSKPEASVHLPALALFCPPWGTGNWIHLPQDDATCTDKLAQVNIPSIR